MSTWISSGMPDVKIVIHSCPRGIAWVRVDPSAEVHVQPRICDHTDSPPWRRIRCACSFSCVNRAMTLHHLRQTFPPRRRSSSLSTLWRITPSGYRRYDLWTVPSNNPFLFLNIFTLPLSCHTVFFLSFSTKARDVHKVHYPMTSVDKPSLLISSVLSWDFLDACCLRNWLNDNAWCMSMCLYLRPLGCQNSQLHARGERQDEISFLI